MDRRVGIWEVCIPQLPGAGGGCFYGTSKFGAYRRMIHSFRREHVEAITRALQGKK